MKYLLILLFLFSSPSFASFEEKTLICEYKFNDEPEKEYFYYFEFTKTSIVLSFELERNKDKYKWNKSFDYRYSTDSDYIYLSVGNYKGKLNRKTLILTDTSKDSSKDIGKCELYSKEEASIKKLQILNQVQEEYNKAREGNKI